MGQANFSEKVIDFRKPKNQDIAYTEQRNTIYSAETVRGENVMDDLLKSYIEKVDRDQVSLREDIRESERRTEKRIEDSEHRMDIRLDKIEDLINKQNDKVDDLKESVNQNLEEDKKYRHNNNIAIVIGVVSTVIAMVGIYYATISTITDILGIMAK